MEYPRPLVVLACGSQSTKTVFIWAAASEADRLTAVVVFPTPPFWLAMAMIFAKSLLYTIYSKWLNSKCFSFNTVKEYSVLAEYLEKFNRLINVN